MKSFRVVSLLDPEEVDRNGETSAFNKLARLLGGTSGETIEPGSVDMLKSADTLEKLARAIESGQARLDKGLREIFGGEDTDEDIIRHNKIEDEYLKSTGQPGV